MKFVLNRITHQSGYERDFEICGLGPKPKLALFKHLHFVWTYYSKFASIKISNHIYKDF